MAAATGKAFDFKMFRRLLEYTNVYKWTFYFVALAAILLSVVGVVLPYLLQLTIDEGIVPQNLDMVTLYVLLMAAVLLLEVLFQFCFIYFANLLGLHVVLDQR